MLFCQNKWLFYFWQNNNLKSNQLHFNFSVSLKQIKKPNKIDLTFKPQICYNCFFIFFDFIKKLKS